MISVAGPLPEGIGIGHRVLSGGKGLWKAESQSVRDTRGETRGP